MLELRVRDSLADAIEEIKTEAEERLNNGRAIKGGGTLLSVFNWDDTPEGTLYWSLIYRLFNLRGDIEIKVTPQLLHWIKTNAPKELLHDSSKDY